MPATATGSKHYRQAGWRTHAACSYSLQTPTEYLLLTMLLLIGSTSDGKHSRRRAFFSQWESSPAKVQPCNSASPCTLQHNCCCFQVLLLPVVQQVGADLCISLCISSCPRLLLAGAGIRPGPAAVAAPSAALSWQQRVYATSQGFLQLV